jgi:hypothetical protein
MFIGHFAVGFGSKRAAPRTSLATLFAAALLADLLWPIFLLLHAEHVEIDASAGGFTPLRFTSYPYSHSLVALAVWGALFAAGYAAIRRSGWAAPLTLFLGVLSHWVLDVVTHQPDMPVTLTGPTRLGLDLWRSRAGTIAVELAMLAVGLALYVGATRARDRIGNLGLVVLVALLLLAYAGAAFGPPPPSVDAVIWSDLAGGVLTLTLAAWVDRQRDVVARAPA